WVSPLPTILIGRVLLLAITQFSEVSTSTWWFHDNMKLTFSSYRSLLNYLGS
ncbi:unnamed protein product, partial [Musa textilis]